ncbi:MAG: hypothetical protein EOM20_08555, partial [Spartobacteria bacterium]|nr:hypothetical protein [Spartobacteria bacterium]
TGEPAHFDNYSVALDRHYEVSAFRTAPGQFACLIADVTARKKAQEELLRAKEAAEATSRAKSEFLANMSHELRTPLNPIIGFAEFLLEDESATEEQREILTIIRKRGEDLLQLLSDILDMARAEAHRLVIKPRATIITQVVGDAVDMFRQSAEEKELQLNMNIGTGLDSPLVLDPVRLRQILLNLIGNAVKFTMEGNVTVSAALENDDALHLLVKDTGPGVPAEKQSLIFEPFEQVDTSFSRLHGGVGLGLPICKRLAELMGGSIRLESAPGQGAAFYVSLPVSHAENITDT